MARSLFLHPDRPRLAFVTAACAVFAACSVDPSTKTEGAPTQSIARGEPPTPAAGSTLGGQIVISLIPFIEGGVTVKEADIVLGPVRPPDCEIETVEHCTFQHCSNDVWERYPRTSIGKIEVESESRQTTLDPDPESFYDGIRPDRFSLWTRHGEKVRIRYAYLGENVSTEQIAPAAIELAPMPREATRTDSLSITWSGAHPEDGGFVDVAVFNARATRYAVECSVRPTAGGVSFTPAMLSRLPPGTFTVAAFSRSSFVDRLGVKHYVQVLLENQGGTITLL